MSLLARTNQLALLVLKELSRAGVCGRDVMLAKVQDHDKLVLQAPPLSPMGLVADEPPTLLHNLGRMAYPLESELQEFYLKTLNGPVHIDKFGGRNGMAQMFGLGHYSPLIFSLPETLDRLSGATFALEMAAFLRSCGQLVHPTVSAVDYYMTTASGRSYGIRNGEPIGADHPVSLGRGVSMHQSLPRGRSYEVQGFTVVDRLICWLYSNKHDVPDVESCVVALTPLRLTGTIKQLGKFEQTLLTLTDKTFAQKGLVDVASQKAAIQTCLTISNRWDLDDRQKLQGMAECLVPLVCTEAFFCSRFGRLDRMARFSSRVRWAKIDAHLNQLYTKAQT